MKYSLILIALLLVNLQIQAATLCEDLEKDLKALQTAESTIAHPKSGDKLVSLQDKYDSAIADYTIYKGIDDLRSSYFKFNEDVTSLNLGNKPHGDNQVMSYLKNFVTNLFGANKSPKVREIQRFRDELRSGMTATAGILVMEDLIDQLFVNESLQQKLTNQNLSYSGDEFLTEVKIQCDRKVDGKSAYDRSPLCQELFVKDTKGTLSYAQEGQSKRMVLGFFDAYKALLRGEKSDTVKQKLEDYKKTLLAQMPKSSYMQKQLKMVQNVDGQLEKSFNQYQSALRTNPNQTVSSSDMSLIMTQVKSFTSEMEKLSLDNQRLLGAKERDAIISATRDAKIKGQFGNIQEVVDSLAASTDKTQDNLISAMMGNHEVNRARRALAAQVPLDGIRTRNPEDEFKNAFNSLGIPSCKDMTFYQSAADRLKHRDALYKCLSDMNKTSNASIAEKIKTAKDKAQAIKQQIKEVEDLDDFKNYSYLKNATIRSIRTNCKSLQEKSCRPEEQNSVLLDGEQHLSYLTNSVGEILSLYDASEAKSGGLSTKEMRERADYCRDTHFSSLAPTVCRSAQTHEQMELVNKSYHFSDDAHGMKSDRTSKASNTEIWLSASKAPIQSMVPFLLQYRNTSTNIGYATEYAKQQKAYNYVMTEYWKDYYEKFPSVGMWGTSSLYPTYYSPLTSTSFNYGSNLYYGTTGTSYSTLSGYNFSN